MKKFMALGVAGLLAVAAIAPTGSAFAASGIPVYPNDNKAPPFLAGAALWWFLQPTYHPLWGPHVRWCKAHYRSYDPATDKYHGRSGTPVACLSP